MKTILFQLKPFTLLLLAITSFTFTACNDEEVAAPSLKDQLVGTWDITSYKLSGDEYIGLIFDSASITFEAYNDEEGQFTQEVTFPDEESTSITAVYTFQEENNKVLMEYDGDIITAEIAITNKNKLDWDGTQDGFPLQLAATKR